MPIPKSSSGATKQGKARKNHSAARSDYSTGELTAACGNQRHERDLFVSRQWVNCKTGAETHEMDQWLSGNLQNARFISTSEKGRQQITATGPAAIL
jgi:hypothetical protein